MGKNIRERAKQGLTSFGLNLALSDPVIVEMAARAGFDFIRIDTEHMLYSPDTLKAMIRTARLLDLPIQVRVPDLGQVTALLDQGVSGIMIPHCSSREAAERAVDAVKYAPLGHRGMTGSSRALDFGKYSMNHYSQWANDEVALIVQIEDAEGLANIDEILSVEGVDMVATGKNDLAQALGVPGQNQHPEVLAAEEMVLQKTLEYGKIPTFLVKNRNRMEVLKEKGVRCFTLGRDELILMAGLKSRLAEFQ